MLGSNLEEGNYLMPVTMPLNNNVNATVADYHDWLKVNFGNLSRQVDRLYAGVLSVLKSPWHTASTIYTESQYLCPTARSARWLSSSKVGNMTDVYTYRLTCVLRRMRAGVVQESCTFPAVGSVRLDSTTCPHHACYPKVNAVASFLFFFFLVC